jgi:hypothetical protein
MSIDLVADIDRLIGKTYADRGRAYARQGRVRESTGAEGRRMVFARVRGSGGSSYTQVISLDWADDGHLASIEGECSCPVVHQHNLKTFEITVINATPAFGGPHQRPLTYPVFSWRGGRQTQLPPLADAWIPPWTFSSK